MARLVWKRLDNDEVTFTLGRSTLIGRGAGADCDVGSKRVSRQHAKIELREKRFYIIDLGSTNGTRVNGTPIRGVKALAQGDLIVVGDEVLQFDNEEEPRELRTRGSLQTEPLSELVTAALRRRTVSRPRSRDVLPRRAGKFQLLEPLGKGGMGTVYRAVDLDSNRQVAVKFIRSDLGRREAFLDFFHNREAVLAREINHPNVIQVYESGVDVERHYISMECVSGESLYQTLKRHKLRPHEVLEILRQIACGLAAAHRQGVVHSDIKPANILLVAEEGAERWNGGLPDHASVDDEGGILEFSEGDTFVATNGGADPTETHGYDREMEEEIQRRVGLLGRDAVMDPPYFERRAETAFLKYYLERTQNQRGYLVLVEGELGAGKDRLISHFLERQSDPLSPAEGSATLLTSYELDCSRMEGLPLLYEQVFGVQPATSEGMKSIAPDLISFFDKSSSLAVIRLLGLGSMPPLVAEFIGQLATLLIDRRLMLIGALNPDELRENAVLKPLLERVASVTKELYLRPLTEYQIQRYVKQVFHNALSGVDLGRDLYRLSGGNFARLLAILHSFFDRGVLRSDPISGRVSYRPRSQEFELEEGKNLYEKYRALGKAEQRVVENAAFIGHRFRFDTLLRFCSIDETSLFFIVRTLLAEEFLVEESRTWYAFSNLAFQNYIAGRLPSSERPHLHRKVSRLLTMTTDPESAQLLQLRANHLYGCREYSKAIRCLLEGAYLARAEYETDLSRRLFQEILRIYRELAGDDAIRKEVVGVLRNWFRRDGNWYEIFGDLASQQIVPRVKIADFGISFRIGDETRGYQVQRRPALGTPRYLAPERAKGEVGGPTSDIYSLGILAYEMIVRRPPFPEAKGAEVIKANQEHKVVFPEDSLVGYPEGTETLLESLVERDPQRRWDADRVLRTILKLQFDQQTGSR
ncbi:MAG: protein kinase [Planctomycetes bacterium]|nr:protein kinase [Planctomycetota bacterium]